MKVKTSKGPTADKNVKPGSKHDPTPSKVHSYVAFHENAQNTPPLRENPLTHKRFISPQ